MRKIILGSIVIILLFLTGSAYAQQLQTNSNPVRTQVGNPSTTTGNSGGETLSWTQRLSDALEIGYDGAYNRMVSDIKNGSYTVSESISTSIGNKYWCTYLVIDAFNLAGFSGTNKQNHGGAVHLMNFFRGNSGYKFLDYFNDDHASVLSQVQPGYAIFYQAVPGATSIGEFDHAAIVKSISVNSHGDGRLETYDSNIKPSGGGKALSYPIDGWNIRGLLTRPSTYSVMGFGTAQ